MFLRCFGAVAVTVFTACQVAAADDPAILACEEVVKYGLKTPKSYERVDAVVVGSEVLLSFDAVNEYNAPIRHRQLCGFTKIDEGHIQIEPPGLQELKLITADFERRSKKVTTQAQADAIIKEGQALQMKVLARQTAAMVIGMRLDKQGLLKIPIDKTTVKVD